MKQFLLIIIVAMGLLSCATKSENNVAKSMDVAKKYMEAVQSSNTALMDSLLDDKYMGYGPSVTDSVNKADALSNWKYNITNLYDSIHYSFHKSIAVEITDAPQPEGNGHWVANWAYLTLKYKDGRGPVNIWVSAFYKIENGKIVRSRTFYNEADVLRQLGYTMTAPQAGQ